MPTQAPVPATAFHSSKLGELARGPIIPASLSALSASTGSAVAHAADFIAFPLALQKPSLGLLPHTWHLLAAGTFATTAYISRSDWWSGTDATSKASCLLALWSFTKSVKMQGTLGARLRPAMLGLITGGAAFVQARATWLPSSSGALW